MMGVRTVGPTGKDVWVGQSTACTGWGDSGKALVACDARCRHNLVTPTTKVKR